MNFNLVPSFETALPAIISSIKLILMIEYTIYCDLCGEMIDIQSGSARQARKKAKAKGLLVRIIRKDYCLKCAEKLQNEGELDDYLTKD